MDTDVLIQDRGSLVRMFQTPAVPLIDTETLALGAHGGTAPRQPEYSTPGRVGPNDSANCRSFGRAKPAEAGAPACGCSAAGVKYQG